MPQNQQIVNAAQPIIESSGIMSQLFRGFILKLSNNIPIVASGSPEGVINAPQYSLYIDEATPLSPVQYRKMLPEVSGDRKKGWATV